jgi:hypothetical protein
VFGKNFREEGSNRVENKWWRNFVRRHRVQLDIGKAVRFDMKRNEWCKQENFLAMYNNVYGKLTEKGIAKELDEEVM